MDHSRHSVALEGVSGPRNVDGSREGDEGNSISETRKQCHHTILECGGCVADFSSAALAVQLHSV